MGTSLAKYSHKKQAKRIEEPKVKPVDSKSFLDGVKKLEPIHVNGYVCLF